MWPRLKHSWKTPELCTMKCFVLLTLGGNHGGETLISRTRIEDSLVVQGLRLCQPKQGVCLWSLVGWLDPTCCIAWPKDLKRKKKKTVSRQHDFLNRTDLTQHHFPGGFSDKEPVCQCRRHQRCGFDPWVRRIPWRRPWLPTPQYSHLENPTDRGAWWATVHGVAKSQTWLCN